MDGWKIRRAVDLQEDSPPVERLRALATLSSRQAHDFVIVVLDGDKPANLTGMQPWLSMILPGRASLQKQVGSVQANVVSVTLPKIGYAERGDVSIILSLMDEDGQTQIPLYGCVIRVMEDSTDTIIDEEKVIPSLAELLAQFDACKAAASAANTAAGKAVSSAGAADTAAKAANTQAEAAQEAAELAGKAAVNAQNAADQINGMTATAAGLNADEAPTANLVKAGDHYELELGIPQGRKGDTGATPKIKLSVVTGEPGTDAKVEQSGTPEEPLVKLTIPRGDTGSLGDLTICGKAPDQAGKVMLTAEDVGALSGTDETLTESGKAADAAATGEALSQLKEDLVTVDAKALHLGDGDAGTGDAPPLNANTLGGKTLTQIFDALYPVGCIYQSTVSTNPAELFGVGTWEAIQGRFLLAESGATYLAGEMGGEAEHTLSIAELPSHDHLITRLGWGGKGLDDTISRDYNYCVFDSENQATLGSSYIAKTGGSTAHNNMPPYLSIYMWKRVS